MRCINDFREKVDEGRKQRKIMRNMETEGERGGETKGSTDLCLVSREAILVCNVLQEGCEVVQLVANHLLLGLILRLRGLVLRPSLPGRVEDRTYNFDELLFTPPGADHLVDFVRVSADLCSMGEREDRW